MRLLIGEKLVEFSDEQLDYMYIDEGTEAEVYKFGNSVLKVYKPFCSKYRLSENDADTLTKINTQRILLPRELLRDPDTLEFKGYSTPFIKACSRSALLNLKMEQFLGELEVLEDDMELLAIHGVDVADFILENMIYDGKIYFCDPGSYIINLKTRSGYIHQNNICELNNFVLNHLFPLVKISKAKREAYNSNYLESECLSWQMRDNCITGETIKQHIKRMTR